MRTDTRDMTRFTPVHVDPGMKVELMFGRPFMTIQGASRRPTHYFTPGSVFGVSFHRRIGAVNHGALAIVEAMPPGLAGDRLPCVSGCGFVHMWLTGAEGSLGHAAMKRACRFIEELREEGTDPATVRPSYYRVVGVMLRPTGMPPRYDVSQATAFLEADLLCGIS